MTIEELIADLEDLATKYPGAFMETNDGLVHDIQLLGSAADPHEYIGPRVLVIS